LRRAMMTDLLERLPRDHQIALRHVLARLHDREIDWALTGSASFSLQGLPLVPEDLDLQTNAWGAYELERCFAEYLVRPVSWVTNSTVRSLWGSLCIEGVEVEIIGDIQKRLPDGTWTAPPVLSEVRWNFETGFGAVPVLDLAYEAQAYAQMGRLRRARLLDEWLHTTQEI
jgi:hypothetical protein